MTLTVKYKLTTHDQQTVSSSWYFTPFLRRFGDESLVIEQVPSVSGINQTKFKMTTLKQNFQPKPSLDAILTLAKKYVPHLPCWSTELPSCLVENQNKSVWTLVLTVTGKLGKGTPAVPFTLSVNHQTTASKRKGKERKDRVPIVPPSDVPRHSGIL